MVNLLIVKLKDSGMLVLPSIGLLPALCVNSPASKSLETDSATPFDKNYLFGIYHFIVINHKPLLLSKEKKYDSSTMLFWEYSWKS